MIGIVAFAAAVAAQSSPSPAAALAAIDELKSYNETRGMDAAKQGMAKGGYGFSSAATPYGLYIMAVALGSRAASAGLRSGEDVVAINGRSTVGMTTEQFLALIRTNPPGGFDLTISNAAAVHLPPLNDRAAGLSPAQSVGSGGCLGRPLQECLAHINGILRIDQGEIAQQLNRAGQTDVNGKPLGGANLLTAAVFFPDSSVPDLITFDRDPSGVVTRVEISLEGSPQFARTPQEYTATGLGLAFRAVLPASCSEAQDDLSVFRFFENVVKPTIRTGDKDTTIDETHASTGRMSQSAALPFCAVKVRYSHLSGYDTDQISETNDHGVYSFPTVAFSR